MTPWPTDIAAPGIVLAQGVDDLDSEKIFNSYLFY